MSHEPAPYANSMPPAWCAQRRQEIQAYIDGDGRRNAQETRTMLIELLSQLSSTEAQLAASETAAAELLARATRAEYERDQWMQESKAHAARAGYCNGQCGICNGECAPPASAPVAPVAGVAAGEGGERG